MYYRVVNDNYTQEPCLVVDWAEFCRMCRECFGDDWEEPERRERADGSIETLEHPTSLSSVWEVTLVPVAEGP